MEIALLENKKTIKELICTNKSILELIKKELLKKEYNFVITADDIPKAKKVMADLNKSKDFIDTFRKAKVSSESLDIDLFKENIIAYIALFDSKREEIKKKLEVYEKDSKDKILKELSLYCESFVKSQNIRFEFIDVNIIDLMLLGSVNPSGTLTKKVKDTIESRVNICKSKQDKYDMRLMQLENLSHRAGLESPLTITHIQGIISLDNDMEYQTKLSELISSEIERQNTIKANIQKQANEKAQRDAHQEVLDGQNRIVSIFNGIASDNSLSLDDKIEVASEYDCTQFAQLENFARAKSKSVVSELMNFKRSQDQSQTSITVGHKEIPVVHETIPANDNKTIAPDRKVVRIQAIFEVEVPSRADSESVLNKVRSRLSKCDINSDTLKSLEVV